MADVALVVDELMNPSPRSFSYIEETILRYLNYCLIKQRGAWLLPTEIADNVQRTSLGETVVTLRRLVRKGEVVQRTATHLRGFPCIEYRRAEKQEWDRPMGMGSPA